MALVLVRAVAVVVACLSLTSAACAALAGEACAPEGADEVEENIFLQLQAPHQGGSPKRSRTGNRVDPTLQELLALDPANETLSGIAGNATAGTAPGEEPIPAHHNNKVWPNSEAFLAILFLFGSLAIGIVLLWLQERYLTMFPYVLLVHIAGITVAACEYYIKEDDKVYWWQWHASVWMWEGISPHLLLYIFLPALIFSEALCVNVHELGRSFFQVLLLAGPGVALCTGLLGAYSKYMLTYGWDWPFALLFGAVLAPTDTVAVTALFKELSVTPRLTVLIAGESLFNDGTAIAVFALMLKLVAGAPFVLEDTGVFVLRMMLLPMVVGYGFGSLTTWLMGFCAGTHQPSDAMIQVVGTICCGYLCFFFAESQFETSGVLTVVYGGITVALKAWPKVVSKDTMHIIWAAIQFIGNTLLFFVAGVIFGNSLFERLPDLSRNDVADLVFLYLVVQLIRLFMVVLFWLPLNLMGHPLNFKEVLVIAWSGIRGALSLTMAIIVAMQKEIQLEQGARVIFHVGGIAALTMLINGTMLGPLLEHVELAQSKELADLMGSHFAFTMSEETREACHAILADVANADKRFQGADAEIVSGLVPTLCLPAARPVKPPGEEAVLQLLQQCRDFFLQVVEKHYWAFIDGGTLLRNAKITEMLLHSTHQARLDIQDVTRPRALSIQDWDILAGRIRACSAGYVGEFFARLFDIWPLRHVPGLRDTFPTEERLILWTAVAALSFQEAHLRAQKEVPPFFSAQTRAPHVAPEPTVDKSEKDAKPFATRSGLLSQAQLDIVLAESREQLRKVEQVLARLPEELVVYAKSTLLARALLAKQMKQVEFLKEALLKAPGGEAP